MTQFLLGLVVGAVLIDFLWAWKMGIVTLTWSKIKQFIYRILPRS
jgi:hypothetical protein